MRTKTNLKIDWATHEAAKYACEHWHYTQKIPVNKLVKIGAWENDKFIGVIIFGMGASAVLHRQFNAEKFEVCELVRVALTSHKSYVSKIMSLALKFLKKTNPKLKIVVSFADPQEGHHGGIYQAGNWIFTGTSSATKEYFFNGGWRHVTDVYKRLPSEKIKALPVRKKLGKYRYVMPLDNTFRDQILLSAKPYPKRATSKDSVVSDVQSEEGGASPTVALHQKD